MLFRSVGVFVDCGGYWWFGVWVNSSPVFSSMKWRWSMDSSVVRSVSGSVWMRSWNVRARDSMVSCFSPVPGQIAQLAP